MQTQLVREYNRGIRNALIANHLKSVFGLPFTPGIVHNKCESLIRDNLLRRRTPPRPRLGGNRNILPDDEEEDKDSTFLRRPACVRAEAPERDLIPEPESPPPPTATATTATPAPSPQPPAPLGPPIVLDSPCVLPSQPQEVPPAPTATVTRPALSSQPEARVPPPLPRRVLPAPPAPPGLVDVGLAGELQLVTVQKRVEDAVLDRTPGGKHLEIRARLTGPRGSVPFTQRLPINPEEVGQIVSDAGGSWVVHPAGCGEETSCPSLKQHAHRLRGGLGSGPHLLYKPPQCAPSDPEWAEPKKRSAVVFRPKPARRDGLPNREAA
ncbi:hypothetical protein PAPYR_10583 [Paratrimastix pyriformis]|uniref:Uncharacterized protein n=1 Tax=Paratrimastix pyriformis TaxID=342808 RepID=A0ABQ8U7E6_9EUKA|nr:hypothetical protein PAPYR_10583 [Paratrimastix pyriformis]